MDFFFRAAEEVCLSRGFPERAPSVRGRTTDGRSEGIGIRFLSSTLNHTAFLFKKESRISLSNVDGGPDHFGSGGGLRASGDTPEPWKKFPNSVDPCDASH